MAIKRAILMSIGVSLVCLTAMAQQVGTRTDGVQTVTGCLEKPAHGGYVITATTPEPTEFHVTGGNETALAAMQGHTVRVTGAVGQSNPQAQATSAPNAESTTGVAYRTIVAQQVHDVSGACNQYGSDKPATAK